MSLPVAVASVAAGNDNDCTNCTFEIGCDCDGSPPTGDPPSYRVIRRVDLTPRRVEYRTQCGDRATTGNAIPVSNGLRDNSWHVVIETADAETPACDLRAARPPTEDLRGDGARRSRDRKYCSRCCRRFCWSLTTVKFVFGLIGVTGLLCLALGLSYESTDNGTAEDSIASTLAFIVTGLTILTMFLFAWRCYPDGVEPIHALCGIESFGDDHLESCHLDHRRWYTGVGLPYPEFQYVTPPPPYTVTINYIVSSSRTAARDDDVEQRAASTSPPPSYQSNATTLMSPPNAGRAPSFRSPDGATITAGEAPS